MQNMEKIKAWDEYEIKARYIPCLLATIFPAHFCILFLGESFWNTFLKDVTWLVVANVSLSLAATLALIQFQCGIAKHWVEESVFGKAGINFPTTTILLYQDSFLSKSMKDTIRKKIENDFNFKLMDAVQEKADTEEAKKLVREANGFIRRLVGKGVMLYQYNIRYGFIRNLIGGALWGSLGSLGCAILYGLQKSWHVMAFFTAFSLLFASLILLKKKILEKFAYQYAETLINEYMIHKGGK